MTTEYELVFHNEESKNTFGSEQSTTTCKLPVEMKDLTAFWFAEMNSVILKSM